MSSRHCLPGHCPVAQWHFRWHPGLGPWEGQCWQPSRSLKVVREVPRGCRFKCNVREALQQQWEHCFKHKHTYTHTHTRTVKMLRPLSTHSISRKCTNLIERQVKWRSENDKNIELRLVYNDWIYEPTSREYFWVATLSSIGSGIGWYFRKMSGIADTIFVQYRTA